MDSVMQWIKWMQRHQTFVIKCDANILFKKSPYETAKKMLRTDMSTLRAELALSCYIALYYIIVLHVCSIQDNVLLYNCMCIYIYMYIYTLMCIYIYIYIYIYNSTNSNDKYYDYIRSYYIISAGTNQGEVAANHKEGAHHAHSDPLAGEG